MDELPVVFGVQLSQAAPMKICQDNRAQGVFWWFFFVLIRFPIQEAPQFPKLDTVTNSRVMKDGVDN